MAEELMEILSAPDYDKNKALQDQKSLLILKKERLERLILAVDDALKGENIMSAFDNSEFEKHKAEARHRWGETGAYKEHQEKTKDYSTGKWNDLAREMDAIFAKFAVCMQKGEASDSAEAQDLVKRLQEHITANYYQCTMQILAGLGQMYTADERFMQNIDKHAPGTAAYVSEAVKIYCAE